jgi:hypothetical protein
MRSYIFTRKERQVVKGFLKGEVKPGEDIMRQVILRARSFSNLASDVELFVRLRKAIGTAST